MTVPKYLINSFAIIGVFSFIFFACAAADGADSPDGDMNNPPAAVGGRYQISSSVTSGGSQWFDVIDTETGVVKSFRSGGGGVGYGLIHTTNTQ
jgi:hypothetical protein